MKTTKTLILIAFIAACIGSIGCGGGGRHSSSSTPTPTPSLTSVQISPATVSVPLGSTKKLTLMGVYSDGAKKDYSGTVTWSSSDTNVAPVDTTGTVSSTAMGAAKITATAGSMTASSDVTISPAELTKIDIGPSTSSTPANTIQQYIAYGIYSDGGVRDVTTQIGWTSSDATIANVASPGVVNAMNVGTATLSVSIDTANLGKVTSTATLTVTGDALAHIAVIPYQPMLGQGTFQRFVALGQFGSDYTNHQLVSVTWSESSGGSVASIDAATGLAQAIGAGRTKITAAAAGISDSVDLTVPRSGLRSIDLVPSSAQIAHGTTQQFKAIGTLDDGSTQELQNVTWSSDRSDLATMDASGLATGKGTGDAKIKATLGIASNPATLKVTGANLVSIVVTPPNPTIPVLDKKQFFATGTFDDGTSRDLTTQVTWLTTNPSVAKITCTGIASTVGQKASSNIKAVFGSVTGSTMLSTSAETVNSVAVSPVSVTVPRGVKLPYRLSGTLQPSGTSQEFELPKWWSSPISIASIDADGLVTARTLDGVHPVGNVKIWGESCCTKQYADLTVSNADIVSLEIISNPATLRMLARGHFSDGSAEPDGWDVTNAVHWTSSNPAVATIDNLGVVKALTTGTTTINATFYAVPGSTVQVSATPISLTVTAGK